MRKRKITLFETLSKTTMTSKFSGLGIDFQKRPLSDLLARDEGLVILDSDLKTGRCA